METLREYSSDLWRAYHRTSLDVMLRAKKKTISGADLGRMSKMLYEMKKLCWYVEAQISEWESGVYSIRPVNPYAKYDEPKTVFAMNYKHMQPDIQRFMDWCGLEYSRVCTRVSGPKIQGGP